MMIFIDIAKITSAFHHFFENVSTTKVDEDQIEVVFYRRTN